MENPLMQANAGITIPNITKEPLGTEGELTVGPDDVNPYRSAEEAAMVESIKQREREYAKRDDKVVRTVPQSPMLQSLDDPTEGDDPFVFDDVGPMVDSLELPFADSEAPSFPDF